MQLISAVSVKTHGSAGMFNIDLPETAKPGIECRTGDPTNDYTILFTFANNVLVRGASVTSGSGSVTSFTVAGRQVSVNLTGVVNAQTIIVTLTGVSDGINTRNVQATMAVLLGDVDANRVVDGNDVSGVQSHTRQTANSMNFRYDVDANGVIDGNDVSTAQSHTRTSLPTGPKVLGLPSLTKTLISRSSAIQLAQ
jgi:hypothetical protein